MKKLFVKCLVIFTCSFVLSNFGQFEGVWADQYIGDLTSDANPTSDDLIETENDPGGTPSSRSVTFGNLWTNLLSTNINTPAKLESVANLGAFFSDYADDPNAAAMRTTLGLTIGTDVLAPDGDGSSLTGVDAATGDSATAFFDAGTIEHERGGLEINISGYNGLLGISGGITTEVNSATELEAYAGLGAFANEYLDDANAAAMRTTLGLAIGTDVEAYDANTAKTDVAETVTANWDFTANPHADNEMADNHSHAADSIDAITEIAAALKSGSDTTLITGTAGASGNCAEFNADGDLVDSGGVCGGSSGDNIAEGDSKSEVVDTGTGYIQEYTDNATDVADAGEKRHPNDFETCWEASPAGTDTCFGVNSSEEFYVSVGGSIVWKVTSAGAQEASRSATPQSNYGDSDCTDDDDNVRFYVNCTDTGSGTEDCDATIAVQIAGTLTDVLTIDADGNINIATLGFTVGGSTALVSGGALGTPSSGNASNLTSFPTLNQNTTGTAAALTANGANCSSGEAPLGVDAAGAAEGCFAVSTASSTDTFTNKTYDGGGTGNTHTHEDGTNPTVGTAQIKIDSTDDQVVFDGGSGDRVLSYTHTECVIVENLAAADDDYEIWMANDAITITGIGVHCRGTCTTGADISLEDRSGNAMTHTTPTHSTGTSNTTFQSVTAANQLVAGEGLAFDVDNAVSPETDEYSICFTYTYDRQ